MQILPPGRRPPTPAAAVAVCAFLLLPAGAAAAPVGASLRVEAASGRPLAPGETFVTDSATLPTDASPACGGSGKSARLKGPTALGLVRDASTTAPPLRPLQVSDKFDFGLLVCGIGGVMSSDSAFWLYKVDHVAPEVGADQYKLKAGDDVLWYFQDAATGANAGDELAILAPARARTGRAFELTVVRYDFGGVRRPADGARVLWRGGEATAGTDGRAKITSPATGLLRLRAVRANAAAGGTDIPSAPVNVCLAARLRECPSVRGKRITGLAAPDMLKGTAGPDVIRSRGGNDRVNVVGGGRDRVHCGAGRDRVRLGRRDRVAADCEVVVSVRGG
jgi:hypothetical protein